MILVKLFNYLRGFLVISVEGNFIERFMNICMRRNIYLWNIKNCGRNKKYMSVSILGFKKLIGISHKTSSSVRIIKRRGIVFSFRNYRRRYALIYGLLVFLILTQVMSWFVWDVEVLGNSKVPTDEILSVLDSSGLSVGDFIPFIDPENIRLRTMVEIPELAFLGISVNGSKVSVEIRERVPVPYVVEKDKPCNIISTADGVIVSIDVSSGEAKVKPGDVVYLGQTLVSGLQNSSVLGVRLIHSSADVRARTWRNFEAKINKTTDERVYTGKVQKKNSIKIFNFKLNFFINDNTSFENYDKISENRILSIGKNISLPVSLQSDVYKEVEIRQTAVPNDEAETAAKNDLNEKIKMLDGAEVVSAAYKTVVEEDGSEILQATFECIENIAVKEEVSDAQISEFEELLLKQNTEENKL